MNAFLKMAAVSIVVPGVFCELTHAAPDVSGRIVLANHDRYRVTIRFGESRHEIRPRAAFILRPGGDPVTFEYWSGNTTVGWRRHTVTKEGAYAFRFQRGVWGISELRRGGGPRPTTRTRPRAGAVSRSIRSSESIDRPPQSRAPRSPSEVNLRNVRRSDYRSYDEWKVAQLGPQWARMVYPSGSDVDPYPACKKWKTWIDQYGVRVSGWDWSELNCPWRKCRDCDDD